MKLTSSCRERSAARSRSRDSARVRRVSARSFSTRANSCGAPEAAAVAAPLLGSVVLRGPAELSDTS